MKKVAVLTHTHYNDSRALRTIRVMAQSCEVHYFFSAGEHDPATGIPETRVHLHPLPFQDASRWIKHTRFYKASAYYAEEVLKTNIPFSLVYCHDIDTSYPGFIIARALNAKLLYDVHDLSLETLNQQFPPAPGFLKKMLFNIAQRTMRKYGRRWERKFIASCDGVLTVTGNCAAYLKEQYQIKEVLVAPNYPALKHIQSSDKIYSHTGLPYSSQIVLYHGALTQGRYLDVITESAAWFDEHIHLVIIGDGPLRGKMQAITREKQLEANVHFFPFLPYSELLETITGASIGLILIDHINLSKKFALANKVTEYMASGIPVLASDSFENRRLLNRGNCGWITKVRSARQLGTFINTLCADKNALKQRGKAGQKAFKTQFNWEKVAPDFIALFERIMSDRSG